MRGRTLVRLTAAAAAQQTQTVSRLWWCLRCLLRSTGSQSKCQGQGARVAYGVGLHVHQCLSSLLAPGSRAAPRFTGMSNVDAQRLLKCVPSFLFWFAPSLSHSLYSLLRDKSFSLADAPRNVEELRTIHCRTGADAGRTMASRCTSCRLST